MKLIYVLLALAILPSCQKPSESIDDLAGFNFPPNNPLKPNTYFNSFALGFVERDTVQNGEDYRLKLFIVNHHKLYSSDSVKPIMKFHFGNSISWGKLFDSGKSVKVIEDTAYIKFTAKDESLKEGEVKKFKWYGSIAVPRPGKADSSFVIQYDYYIQ